MKHWIRIAAAAGIFLCLCGCGDKTSDRKKEEVKTTEEALMALSQEKEGWWLKRREGNQPPEVSDKIDLSKYDAYYMDPKASDSKKSGFI